MKDRVCEETSRRGSGGGGGRKSGESNNLHIKFSFLMHSRLFPVSYYVTELFLIFYYILYRHCKTMAVFFMITLLPHTRIYTTVYSLTSHWAVFGYFLCRTLQNHHFCDKWSCPEIMYYTIQHLLPCLKIIIFSCVLSFLTVYMQYYILWLSGNKGIL